MGNFISFIKNCGCSDFYKYVLNDCKCHSACSDCCDFEIETHETGGEHSEESLDVGNLVHYHSEH